MKNRAISPPPGNPGFLMEWYRRVAQLLRVVDGYEISWTPALVAGNSTNDQTVAVKGLNVDDVVYVNLPSYVSGVVVAHARVGAADTLKVTFANVTAGNVTPPAGTYKVMAVRI
jgi:hypothetical protein